MNNITLKVRDYPNLIRDPKSKAIININRSAAEEHLSKQQDKKNIQQINEEINNLKKDFQEIKELLQKIVCKG